MEKGVPKGGRGVLVRGQNALFKIATKQCLRLLMMLELLEHYYLPTFSDNVTLFTVFFFEGFPYHYNFIFIFIKPLLYRTIDTILVIKIY